ncbi:MAG TPA: hypothetical protein VGD95_08125 [Micavibrio sp.]
MTGVLCVAAHQSAYALKLTLKRAVFEGNHRAEVLTIVNTGTEEETYRLGWRTMRMTEDDALVAVPGDVAVPGLMPADQLVRFAPRRIVVPPGGSQQVRLMLTKPKDLAAGEYRSHLWLQPEANQTQFDKPAPGAPPKIQLKMLTGMTIPVIVRHGDMSVKATLADLRVKPRVDAPVMDVSFTIGRQGNRSLYGDLKFLCGDMLVRTIKGIAVYTEVQQRHLQFDVSPPAGQTTCPSMTVQYFADPDDASLKGALLASAEIAVP